MMSLTPEQAIEYRWTHGGYLEALDIITDLRRQLADKEEHYKALEDVFKTVRQERDSLKSRFTSPIVCMCGSTRFKQAWISENARLTGKGNIVLAVGLWGHHERQYPDPGVKEMLDALHKRKIDLCNWVWVLDVNGYVGDSTRSEIEYAEAHSKPVRYLSKEFPEYVEPIDPMEEEIARLREALEHYADIDRKLISITLNDHTAKQALEVK